MTFGECWSMVSDLYAQLRNPSRPAELQRALSKRATSTIVSQSHSCKASNYGGRMESRDIRPVNAFQPFWRVFFT
jgi:hypothetical protein